MTALLPLTQVARLMGCAPETALELAQARRLPFERNPSGVYVAPLDLAAWLAAARHARPDGDV
jgi:hypothetical protein